MRAPHLVLLGALLAGCATADEGAPNVSYKTRADAADASDDVVVDAPTKGDSGSDTIVVADTGTVPDSSVPDSGDVDSGVLDTGAADSGAPDTEPPDTGVADTGTPDTGTTCGPADKYGPKCKTNADCAAITGCGYTCCAFDPILMTNLGCGRISLGSTCLP